MFGSCPPELDREMLPLRMGVGQSSNMFYGISVFFKHNFCFSAEIFKFIINPQCKIGWPPDTWTGCSVTHEMKKLFD